MDTSKLPAPLQQNSDNLFCDICNIKCDTPQSLKMHCFSWLHTQLSRDLAHGLFGYLPEKPINCFEDILNGPREKGSLIGLHYVKNVPKAGSPLFLSCNLCGVRSIRIFEHLLSIGHKKKYIFKRYSLLFKDRGNLSTEIIEKIATVIAEVEGLQASKTVMVKKHFITECLPRQTFDKIVAQLRKHHIGFSNDYVKLNKMPCLMLGYHKPCMMIGFRSCRTNEEKNTINPSVSSEPNSSVPSEPSAISKCTTIQVQDNVIEKQQNHQLEFKDTCRKEITMSCLENGSYASEINEENGKRPPQFTPPPAFKRCKSELPHQYAGNPTVSLSGPVSVPFSVTHSSVGVPDPIPSLCSSYQIAYPLVEEPRHPWPPTESCYQNADCGYRYSDQSLYGFSNHSLHGQASSLSDVGHAYAFGGESWGQETGHQGEKHLHTLWTIGGSVSPPKHLSGQCVTEASLEQDTTSRYGSNSVDSRELYSKCSSASRIISVLNKEPSVPQSLGNIRPPEGLSPTTSTSSCAQTLQSTNSSMSSSMLSPDTLKILQGRDPTSVKSILKRLAEYCPELQQVNISLFVEMLFESGALQ